MAGNSPSGLFEVVILPRQARKAEFGLGGCGVELSRRAHAEDKSRGGVKRTNEFFCSSAGGR